MQDLFFIKTIPPFPKGCVLLWCKLTILDIGLDILFVNAAQSQKISYFVKG